MADGKIVYTPPKLPDPEGLRPRTVFLDNNGDYWELSEWVGQPERSGVWYRLNKARIKKLKKEGKIPQ